VDAQCSLGVICSALLFRAVLQLTTKIRQPPTPTRKTESKHEKHGANVKEVGKFCWHLSSIFTLLSCIRVKLVLQPRNPFHVAVMQVIQYLREQQLVCLCANCDNVLQPLYTFHLHQGGPTVFFLGTKNSFPIVIKRKEIPPGTPFGT
jgi:hypothetical protein